MRILRTLDLEKFLLRVNVTRYFYFLVSNDNLTLLFFHVRVVAIKTDESETLVQEEANLVPRPDEFTSE